MRDQINGQLYDAWRCDCDDPETKRFLGGFACRVSDDHTHGIIPVDEDAAYEGDYDCNKISTVAGIGESLQQGTPCRKNVADDVGMFAVDQNGCVGGHLVHPILRDSGDIARYNSLGGTADAHAWARPYERTRIG